MFSSAERGPDYTWSDRQHNHFYYMALELVSGPRRGPHLIVRAGEVNRVLDVSAIAVAHADLPDLLSKRNFRIRPYDATGRVGSAKRGSERVYHHGLKPIAAQAAQALLVEVGIQPHIEYDEVATTTWLELSPRKATIQTRIPSEQTFRGVDPIKFAIAALTVADKVTLADTRVQGFTVNDQPVRR